MKKNSTREEALKRLKKYAESDLPDGRVSRPIFYDPRVAGAIFDFAAWLTTQPGTLEIGRSHDAAPMAEAVRKWGRARLFDTDDADVITWQDGLPSRDTGGSDDGEE